MFLNNCWYVAAWSNELRDSNLSRRILGRPVLLFRSSQGPVAFLDRCPHRLVPLSAGTRVGDSIRCGYHGMVFGPDGRCQHIPGQDAIPDNARATIYPIREQHGLVWIWMGSTDLADPDLIPHVPWAALDEWTAASGYMRFAADYRLLTDNLLDLSHENYIHASTIGNQAEESIAAYGAKVSVEDARVVRAHREMPNIVPPPMFAMMMKSSGRINRWQTALWTAPAINITDVGAQPVDSPIEDAFVARILHLLTPETASSTHYFWAHCRRFRQDDQELTASIHQAHVRTFCEDRAMLELQQQSLEEAGTTIPKVALRVDDAPLRARRMLSALIKQEEASPSSVLSKIQHIVPEGKAYASVA